MPKPRKPKQETVTTDDGRVFPLYERRLTGKEVPCDGEAHSNPWIDHCGRCAPRWGVIEEKEPELDLGRVMAANAEGFAVACSDAVYDQLPDGCLTMVTRKYKGGGNTSFFAILPKVKS